MTGNHYRYPNDNQIFILKEIKGFVYVFECGKRITDNVFVDLICVKGVQAQLFV